MKTVVIIGTDITGLTAAFYLKSVGVSVTVFEAGTRLDYMALLDRNR